MKKKRIPLLKCLLRARIFMRNEIVFLLRAAEKQRQPPLKGGRQLRRPLYPWDSGVISMYSQVRIQVHHIIAVARATPKRHRGRRIEASRRSRMSLQWGGGSGP